MPHMSELTHGERIKRLRDLVTRLRRVPNLEGHTPYVLDAIEMIVDELEDIAGRGQTVKVRE